MATRRTNVRVDVPIPPSTANGSFNDQKTSTNEAMGQLDAPPPFGSPFLPTLLEAGLLAIYPATLLLGSIFSTLTINHDETPYLPHLQSYDPSNAPSYFAKKSNVFNVYFVKVGWAWVTLAFALHIISNTSLGPTSWLSAPGRGLTRSRLQAAARWAVMTSLWYAVTQDFFGSPLIDRGFRFTGGRCEVVLSDDPESQARQQEMPKAEEAFTHAACRLIGGQWKGGHDISGHVFLLVMGSAMLWLEVLPTVLPLLGLTTARRVRATNGKVRGAIAEVSEKPRSEEGSSVRRVAVNVALGVAGISWWMLLMTAAYFHTWFEKTTGLLLAFTAIYLVYFLPRAIPALRQALGLPGL